MLLATRGGSVVSRSTHATWTSSSWLVQRPVKDNGLHTLTNVESGTLPRALHPLCTGHRCPEGCSSKSSRTSIFPVGTAIGNRITGVVRSNWYTAGLLPPPFHDAGVRPGALSPPATASRTSRLVADSVQYFTFLTGVAP